MSAYTFELFGILITLGLLIFLALQSHAAFADTCGRDRGRGAVGVLAKRTTGRFTINFFPLFLLGGAFGKSMDDRG